MKLVRNRFMVSIGLLLLCFGKFTSHIALWDTIRTHLRHKVFSSVDVCQVVSRDGIKFTFFNALAAAIQATSQFFAGRLFFIDGKKNPSVFVPRRSSMILRGQAFTQAPQACTCRRITKPCFCP